MSETQLSFDLPVESERALPSVFGIKERLVKLIADRLQQYKSEGIKLPAKDVFLAAAKAAFEKYVVAFDIPGIGPIIEKAVDDAMEAAFLKLVEAMYDRFAART